MAGIAQPQQMSAEIAPSAVVQTVLQETPKTKQAKKGSAKAVKQSKPTFLNPLETKKTSKVKPKAIKQTKPKPVKPKKAESKKSKNGVGEMTLQIDLLPSTQIETEQKTTKLVKTVQKSSRVTRSAKRPISSDSEQPIPSKISK